ncbi:molybdenum cofactor biosynthesis protein MoaE [Gordonia sp. HNM0687]|uniref:Molybdenum cofactor biosynthesis protein MoaE n=1 Tax=Gordonia mangrovi TaxID=2665643 RepID=A0A6L7GVI0_9ACTN|nr:molybdenum cofactor biosynthesis protein MoaE [Gordonia mangrovi]MDY6807749.1 molybdenum cofactor biosynthesis protein MoaE [Actinomycetota bacterium]MXP22655.1 molybdenum cofactor biosynthesis protein MoaE [Gordonia mangrovi]UVF76983.1 molybdenum cofactor biosynthesis protein MoaE [Gordonia mangrovi]
MSDTAAVQVVRSALADEPIGLSEHEDLVARAAGGRAGAVVGFVGAVRNHDDGREVTRLDYSAHPTAPDVLRQVVEAVVSHAEGVRAVAVSHRVGDLAIGDAAFVVAVAADHRRAAFEICAELVDQVKAQLPVWKHQHFGDGTEEWVGSA